MYVVTEHGFIFSHLFYGNYAISNCKIDFRPINPDSNSCKNICLKYSDIVSLKKFFFIPELRVLLKIQVPMS